MTRDNSVWHVPFYADGSVQRVGRFSSSFGIGGPGGMALDAEGDIFVVHSTLGTTFVHRANGDLVRRFEARKERGRPTCWRRIKCTVYCGERDRVYLEA